MPKYTPQELSRIKAERDLKDLEAINNRRQQEQLQRQLQQVNRMPGNPAVSNRNQIVYLV